MFRVLYQRIKRFLAWLNGRGPSTKNAVREAENHRWDIGSRYGGPGDGYSP